MAALDISRIQDIAEQSKVYGAITNALLNRLRDSSRTDLRLFYSRLLNGFRDSKGTVVTEACPDATMDDVIEYFRALQAEGAGVLVEGRGREPSRFEWNYSIRSIADTMKDPSMYSITELNPKQGAAAKRRVVAKAITRPSTKVPPKPLHTPPIQRRSNITTPQTSTNKETTQVSITLRPNFEVTVKLPSDYSKEDASKLARFFASLVP
jgi:hypothetical protein